MNKRRAQASPANRLTQAIITHLTLDGYNVWRQNNGAVYDAKRQTYRKNPLHKKGVPDIIGFHKKTGVFICVEVKIGKDKLSPEQLVFLKSAGKAGCISIVAKNYDDFVNKYNKKYVRKSCE